MNLPSADLQRLLAEEPFVRSLAASLIADEADDVVQLAYLRALEHRPAGLREPRAWLVRIVRNLVADRRRARLRDDARAAMHGAPPPPLVPSSAELAEREERRRALVAAVDALAEPLRTVVLLRWFDGLPPRTIARSLGVPVPVVWNRLRAALVALRARLDREHGGDRRAWALPLVPLAASPRSLPWPEVVSTSAPAATPALVLGVLAMTTKLKVALATAVVLVGALAWFVWGNGALGPRLADDVVARAAASAYGATSTGSTADAGAPAAAAPREAMATAPPPATTGSLVAIVRYADEPAAAAGVVVALSRAGEDFRVGGVRAVTDADGKARFDGLPPGPALVHVPGREMPHTRTTVEAGATAECTLQQQHGMTLTGVVVDTTGTPIGGALVEVARPAMSGADAEPLAVTAPDGTFTVRACTSTCVVGARAKGFAASQMHFCTSKKGGTETVRIELLSVGGSVEGVVLGPAGTPLPGVVVRVGEGRTELILATAQGAPPLPAQVRTDAEGRFVAIGVPIGTQPILARALDLAPWRGTCEVAAGGTSSARITMTAGVTCRGRALDDAGEPAADVFVSIGEHGAFESFSVTTDTTGSFSFLGLPPGDIDVTGEKRGLGRVTTRIRGAPGSTVECELRLGTGPALRGRIVDETGKPLAGVRVHGETEDEGKYWNAQATSDAEGGFKLAGCPEGRTFFVIAGAPKRVTATRSGLRVGDEVVLQVPRETAPRARIVGRLLRPDGTGAAGETVEAYRTDAKLRRLREEFVTVVGAGDGAFAVPVPAGTWLVRILVKDHPQILFHRLALAAGEVRDLGVLQIVRGGTLRVDGDGVAKLSYRVLGSDERFVCAIVTVVQPLRTELLAPGAYRLQVWGEGIVAHTVPFTIEAERETVLTVVTRPGVRQRLEFALPAGAELPRWIGFVLRRERELVQHGSVHKQEQGLLTGDVWLAPGDYELSTSDREPATTVRFTVPAGDAASLRVVLR